MNISRLTGAAIFAAFLVFSGVARSSAQEMPGGALGFGSSAERSQLGAVARDLGMLKLGAAQVSAEVANRVSLSLVYDGEQRALLLEPEGIGTAAVSAVWDGATWRAPEYSQDSAVELRFVDEEVADIWGGYGYVGTLNFSLEGSEYLGRMAREMIRAYGWVPEVVRVPCPSCRGVVPGVQVATAGRLGAGTIGDVSWYNAEEREFRFTKADRIALVRKILKALEGMGDERIWRGDIRNWGASNESSGVTVYATSVQVVVPAWWFGGAEGYWESFDITIVGSRSGASSLFFGIQATAEWDLIVDGYSFTKAGGSVAPAPDKDFDCLPLARDRIGREQAIARRLADLVEEGD